MADFGVTEILTATAIAASVVGAGVSYMGAQQAAGAASAQANYSAQVAANNKVLADQAADTALQQGQIAQQQKANQEAVLIGQQKAGLAANGVDVGSGSAVDLLSDTKAAGQFDQITIANNAQRTAAGYRNQGINYANQATLDQASSQAALEGGALKGAASLISGAGSVASTWYNIEYNPKSPFVKAQL